MIRYRRMLIIWSVGMALAKLFFPFGLVWLGLGSLALLPLKDYLDHHEAQKQKKLREQRYLFMLEAANVYFQDAFSVGQFLHKIKSQARADDHEWTRILFWIDQSYQPHLNHKGFKDLLSSYLPREAEFFLDALFGPEIFKEQLAEISLTSLRYFRQVVRSDLELEASVAAQKSEAQVMLVLPFIFRAFMPYLLVTEASNSLVGIILSSFAWILTLAAISLFLKRNKRDDSFEHVWEKANQLFLKIPSLKKLENISGKLLQSRLLFTLQEAWHLKNSNGRTRINTGTFDPSLTDELTQLISRMMAFSLAIALFFLCLNAPGWALGVLLLGPLILYLKIKGEGQKSIQALREDFPEMQHRLYLYLIAGHSLTNAWQELLTALPLSPLSEDWHKLQYLIQGGSPILEALTIWSHNIKITEIQESIALLQRYVESGSRESLLRFGEQMIEQASSSQIRQQIKKSQLQTRIMIPIMLDLVSIIFICLIPALGAFGGL